MSKRELVTLWFMLVLSAELMVVGSSFLLDVDWAFVLWMQLLVVPSTFLLTVLFGRKGE